MEQQILVIKMLFNLETAFGTEINSLDGQSIEIVNAINE